VKAFYLLDKAFISQIPVSNGAKNYQNLSRITTVIVENKVEHFSWPTL